MAKLKFKSVIFKSFNKSTFILIFSSFFFVFLLFFFFCLIYIKMSRNLSGKYYQESKERLQKIAPERYQNF